MVTITRMNDDAPEGAKKEMSFVKATDKLTSDVYTTTNPPQDWADVAFLVPHEAIRYEMKAMVGSVEALHASKDDETAPWKALYFSQWFVDYFYKFVHEHHDAEELIYFPFLETKVQLPDKDELSHEVLIFQMNELKALAETMIEKKGIKCSNEIAAFHEKLGPFHTFMRAHLKEEEQVITPLLREHFTEKEHDEAVDKIIKTYALEGAKVTFPAIKVALSEWGTTDFNDFFMSKVPLPIRHLMNKYYIPDYERFAQPMRDAPLETSKPKLHKTPCCLIPGCIPCVL